MSDAGFIQCPKCAYSFEITEAMSGSIEAKLRAKYEADAAREQQKLAAQRTALAEQSKLLQEEKLAVEQRIAEQLAAERKRVVAEEAKKASAAVAQQLEAMQTKLAEADRNAEAQRQADAKARAELDAQTKALAAKQAQLEASTKRQVEELAQARATLDDTVRAQLDKERKQLAEAEAKRAAEAVQLQVSQLQARVTASQELLKKAQESELQLRLKQDEVEQQRAALQLEIARAKDEAKAQAIKQKDDEFRLKEMQFQLQLQQVKEQLDDARQKAEQGSQQLQGEALEIDLQNLLESNFVTDEIVEVKKGAKGGDVVQNVRNEQLQVSGSILWECKSVRNWQKDYVDKARANCVACKAQVAVIVTTAPPAKAFDGMLQQQDVWIVSPALALPLAIALRQNLSSLAQLRRSFEGKHDKMSDLYDFVMGDEFGQRIKYIVDTFQRMKKQVDDERKVFEKQWVAREKMIEVIMKNTTGLIGNITAIGGRDMPALDGMGVAALLETEA